MRCEVGLRISWSPIVFFEHRIPTFMCLREYFLSLCYRLVTPRRLPIFLIHLPIAVLLHPHSLTETRRLFLDLGILLFVEQHVARRTSLTIRAAFGKKENLRSRGFGPIYYYTCCGALVGGEFHRYVARRR